MRESHIFIKRGFLLALYLVLTLSPVLFPGAGAEEEEELISFDFNGADIRLVIKFVSEISGTDFIIDQKVKGKITVISPIRIPVEEACQVLQSILEVQGFTLIPAGRMVKIVPSTEAKGRSIPTGVGKEIEEISPGDAILTQLIPLEHAAANEVKTVLGPLVSKGNSNMVTYTPTNTLILTETSSNLQRLLKIVKEIDVPGPRIVREVISLQYASAAALSRTIASAIQKQPVKGKKAGQIPKVISDERTNSLIVVANSEDMEEIKILIRELDKETPAALSKVNIYYLENADAEDLAKVLTSVNVNPQKKAGGPPSRLGARPGEEKATIVADKATNSLIIAASPEDHAMFRTIIDKLDIMRDQVLVEMLIAEVSMDLTRQLGIELATLDEPKAGSVRGFGGSDFTGAIQSLAGGQPSFSGLVMGLMKGQSAVGGLNVGALLQAYQADSDFNVLAAPYTVTSDNEEAVFRVGEEIAYVKDVRYTESADTIKSWAYKDVGIDLKVTPQINKKRFVRMKIEGKISKSVAGPVPEAPNTVEREATTIVTVKDGHTVVIGGLTRDDKDKSVRKVPLLGDIPILGWLFRRSQETTTKRNLLIFITPHVIASAEEMEVVTEEREKQQKELMKKSRGNS